MVVPLLVGFIPIKNQIAILLPIKIGIEQRYIRVPFCGAAALECGDHSPL